MHALTPRGGTVVIPPPSSEVVVLTLAARATARAAEVGLTGYRESVGVTLRWGPGTGDGSGPESTLASAGRTVIPASSDAVPCVAVGTATGTSSRTGTSVPGRASYLRDSPRIPAVAGSE